MNEFSVDQYKFEDISINNKVNIADFWIGSYNSLLNSDFINKLKLIESAKCKSPKESPEYIPKVIDDVIICFDFNEDDNYEILNFWDPEYFNVDNKINHLSLFKKIELNFDKINYSKFKLIKHSFPFCKMIDFRFKLSDKYEILTNPILYQNGVESLKFDWHNGFINLSDKFISNINEIKPKSVYIQHEFYYRSKLNFIDILTELPDKMKITFGTDIGSKSTLWFSNTVLKIFQNDRVGFALFKWKSFKVRVWLEIENIKRKRHSTDPYSDWFALCLDEYGQVEFDDFKLISEKEQAEEVDKCFPLYIPDSESKRTVLILAKDLIDAKLFSWIIPRKVDCRTDNLLFLRSSKLISSIFTILLPNDLRYITNISKLPPLNIELILFDEQILL